MMSFEEVKEIFIQEGKISFENLYKVYQALMEQPLIKNNFELKKDIVWKKRNKLQTEYLSLIKDKLLIELDTFNWNYGIETDFWKIIGIYNLVEEKWELRKKIKVKSHFSTYLDKILNHMIPINNIYIDNYINTINTNYQEAKQKYEKKKEYYKAKKELDKQIKKEDKGGIYGIYEDGQLVYIGMTMRSFEDRWNEHKKNIEKKSQELNLYSLINPNAKIEFKKILEISQMFSDSQITKRDIQAMEFALIMEHKPKYNFAGRILPYIFND